MTLDNYLPLTLLLSKAKIITSLQRSHRKGYASEQSYQRIAIRTPVLHQSGCGDSFGWSNLFILIATVLHNLKLDYKY